MGIFLFLNLFIIIRYKCRYSYTFMQNDSLQNKSVMAFKFGEAWGGDFFYFKSQEVGQFLIFHAKLQVLNWFYSFE